MIAGTASAMYKLGLFFKRHQTFLLGKIVYNIVSVCNIVYSELKKLQGVLKRKYIRSNAQSAHAVFPI